MNKFMTLYSRPWLDLHGLVTQYNVV